MSLCAYDCLCICFPVPGPCEPEDLINGIIFAANYLGSTQLLSDRNPSKSVRMKQAQEAVDCVKVSYKIFHRYSTYSEVLRLSNVT